MKNMADEGTMKNMYKYLSLLLTAVIALTLLPSPALAGEAQGRRIVRWAKDELVVGQPTAVKGDFFTEMFGNNTVDIDVRTLLYGYNLIHWDQSQGVYLFDESVVKDMMALTSGAGNKTYYIALYDDLCYSDGSPITAWDYAFSILLRMSPEIGEIGGKIYRAAHIAGSGDYLTGKTDYLAGVRVLDEHQLSITLDHNYLPFFYELSLLMCNPYPIREIAPGCSVYDDGFGVYIANEDRTVQEAIYTSELLKKTILDPENGYNSHPRVVSGPYQLLSFDGVTAHFEANPFFKGVPRKYLEEGKDPNGVFAVGGHTRDMDGSFGSQPKLIRPSIQKLAFTWADNDTLVQDLKEGRLDLVNKVVYADTIKEGLKAKLQNEDYPRVGLSFMTFTCDRPAVHEKEVRQAIAWCMDRDGLTKSYCGEYGVRVDGYYGMEQWEYLLVTHKLKYPVNFEDEEPFANTDLYTGVDLHTEGDWKNAEPLWKALSLNNLTKYYVSLEKANALLDQAGWTLNEGGRPIRQGRAP